MSLKLQFVGEIFGGESRIHRANVVGFVEIGVAVGSVDAPQRQSIGDALDAEQFLRRQNGCQGRIGIGAVKVATIVQAAEHTGGIALAQLLLYPQAVVILAEIERHEIERRGRGRLETKRTAQRIHVAPVDIAVVVEIGRIAVAV